MLPYGRQTISDDDIQAVVDVLRSDWLTTGPMVGQLERAIAQRVGAAEAVAVSSGTAALHAAMFALGIGPGDEVIVPAMTFAATANCVVYQGGTPVFADVAPHTLLIDLDRVEALITPRTRAILAVDYAGQPCDYQALRSIAARHGTALAADASHSLGAADRGRPVGSLADLSTFSLHPVKPITSGEGGLITTDDSRLACRMRQFRNHGFTADHHQRSAVGSWHYEMTDLGYNYRLTDIQCALGLSQLRRLDGWTARRQEIAAFYDQRLARLDGIEPLATRDGASHARHLYVVRIHRPTAGIGRAELFSELRQVGIGVAVHYIPVHLHPFYRERFKTGPGLCPVAEAAYEEILSLPLFPAMSDDDAKLVVEAMEAILARSRSQHSIPLRARDGMREGSVSTPRGG
jgi:perosamine synthetase